jgi:glucans biosynthesis protein
MSDDAGQFNVTGFLNGFVIPVDLGGILTMKSGITRRTFLTGALFLPWLSCFGQDARAEVEPPATFELGPAQPFSFDWLKEQARQLAAQPYQLPLIRYADVLDRIGYAVHEQIRYRPEAALWARGDGPYPVQFFHLARLFKEPVKCYMVHDGVAQEIRYSRKLFQYDDDAKFAESLPDDMGFAGFLVMNSMAQQRYWLSFLGASYFRSSGELDERGISARGIAIDTGLPNPEEFPRFTSFWLEAGTDPGAVMIYALLEGPSITGAYRIEATRHERVVMNIEALLLARTAIRRLGIAPLTSMYWFSETNRWQQHLDWRPEVHDSDGLALWKSNGERLWRPLNNPPWVQTNSFLDNSPKGFGLLQRDRSFENYQDDNVFYDRRPSLWVEPLEPWGEGAVQLVEIPTAAEYYDNTVAYWLPKAPVQAGSTWNFKYRLHWLADEPYPPALGRIFATWLKPSGIPNKPYPANKVWLVIDFAGGPLEHLEKDAPVKLMVDSTGGKLISSSARQMSGTKRWRGTLDIELESGEPIDIRAYLRLGDQALTETWLYQFIPRPV